MRAKNYCMHLLVKIEINFNLQVKIIARNLYRGVKIMLRVIRA